MNAILQLFGCLSRLIYDYVENFTEHERKSILRATLRSMKHHASHSSIKKTNALRILDAAGIAYEARTYKVDENDLGAAHVAETVGLPVEQMFKTLVLTGDATPILVCCISGAFELDLKKVARASGNKKVEMLPMKKLFETVGYIRGGTSPIGMKKQFPTFIDETAQLFEKIAISGGERGIQILISPDDVVDVCDAQFADLAQ